MIWFALGRGVSDERLREARNSLLRKSEEAAAQINKTIRTLYDDGFLIKVPDGDAR